MNLECDQCGGMHFGPCGAAEPKKAESTKASLMPAWKLIVELNVLGSHRKVVVDFGFGPMEIEGAELDADGSIELKIKGITPADDS
jgi:hypothetical protein